MFITKYLRWATITYWNYNKPHEKQFNCYEDSIQLYQNLTSDKINKTCEHKQYFNLEPIQSIVSEKNEKLKKLFKQIGNGVIFTLDREEKKIRLDNNCDINVYWTCPGLFDPNQQHDNRKFKSNRLRPNESTVIYDYDLIKLNEKISILNLCEFHIINISFGKYWGYDFKRNSLVYCPYWVNISVNLDYFN